MYPLVAREGQFFVQLLVVVVTQLLASAAVAERTGYLVNGVVTWIDNPGQTLGEDLPFQLDSIVRGSLKFDSSISDTTSNNSRGRYPSAITDFELSVDEYHLAIESADVTVSNVPSCFGGGGDRVCDSFGFSSRPPLVTGALVGGKAPTSAGVSINAGDLFWSDSLSHAWTRAIRYPLPLVVYFDNSNYSNPVALRASILITPVPEPASSLQVLLGLFAAALAPVRIVR